AQYGYGPITSENGQESTSTVPLTSDQTADLAGAGRVFEYSVIGLFIGSLFFGTFRSWRPHLSFWEPQASRIGAFVALFVFAARILAYWGVSLAIVVKNLRDILISHPTASIAERFDIANEGSLRLYLAEVYLPMINYILSDAVVVWRAWTLWPQRRWLIFPVPFFFISGSLMTTFVIGGLKIRALTNDSDEIELVLAYMQIVSWSLSLGTNFVATVLVGLKAWKFRRSIGRDLKDSERRVRVEKILTLLVETGALYCFTQVALVVSWFIPLSNTTAWASDVFDAAAVQLAAIYPTVIIALVSLDR
ncbi:hypothetical protein K488DRAFT_28803, partial [Vararia minispora EC-137]